MSFTRRRFLGASATTAGALMLARPQGALARSLPTIDGYGTARASRLVPGEYCVHADMHNHSLFSDGDGQPTNFYGLMRDAGLDAAALTDHSVISDLAPFSHCGTFAPLGNHYSEADANEASKGCQGLSGLNEMSWASLKGLADDADTDGAFAAIAGFEWSSPTLGHVNVWFSREFTDPLHTGGLGGLDDALRYAETEGFPVPPEVVPLVDQLIGQVPAAGDGITGLHRWLKAAPGTPGLGGGADGIFGFNHPGREPSRFEEFALDPALVDRAVSMELFNKRDDYLFELTDRGRPSPLVACLDAGWRPGILGTSDEHGTDWGAPDDKGRAGMYVTSLSRGSIRAAMQARRFFAARGTGIRFDATANGTRMGTTLGHRSGPVRFHVDLDRGPGWYGSTVSIQVLMTGATLPTVVDVVEVPLPAPDQPVITFEVPIDTAAGRWVVLRVSDPAAPVSNPSPDGSFDGFGYAIAYSSPFFLDPDAAPAPTVEDPPTASPDPEPVAVPLAAAAPPPTGPAGGPTLPTTGGGRLSVVTGAAAMALGAAVSLRSRRVHHHDH